MIKSCLILSFWGCICVAATAQPDDIPFAQPGKCYAKCFTPDKYETVTEQVVLREASEEAKAVQAQFETITAYVVAKEACTRFVVEPAQFETVTEKIMVTPAGKRLPASAYDTVREVIVIKPETRQYTVTEAVFEPGSTPVVTEDAYTVLEVLPQQYTFIPDVVEIRAASTRWVRKKADRDCLGADPEDCFVWCLVETPAQYVEFTKKELAGCGSEGADDCVQTTFVAPKTTDIPVLKVKKPAATTESVIPAETKMVTKIVLKNASPTSQGDEPAEFITVTKQILKRPARVREEYVPAEYKPIQRKALKNPATVVYEPVPAEYAPVVKRKIARKGGFSQWREIVCGEKITGYTVRQIQEALKALGYFKGAPEPSLGARTKAALAEFQKDRDLPADGNIDIETLQALGISY